MNNRMLSRFREYLYVAQFNAIKLSLATAKKIRSLSYGEVKKIETFNYRTLKPENDGLFCAVIFGPTVPWTCNCGKYKRMKHRGVTCEKCGVEVIESRVRRERMGHIELATPVCHIWYLKGMPSVLALIMDMPVKDLEKVIYFDAYMVIHQGNSPYVSKTLLSNADYNNYIDAHPEDTLFVAEIGAEAVKSILVRMDLKLEVALLREEYAQTSSVAARHKIMKRIKIFSDLIVAEIDPSAMILDVIPVLPPDLRPLVPLDGGRFASADSNEFYRRVLNRNNRLKRLKAISAPEVIIKNEKHMLQEAVDNLFDNGRRGQPVLGSNKRPLKSLSDVLKGKQGRFRQNLLGRRVDYSARSVIVVDPNLRMDQCGIPKIMALELFKPHVYGGLFERELVSSLRAAKRMVDECDPIVWDVLEQVVADYPLLLNRAPTLHKLGILAFYPVLVDGKAIHIHPLVCAAFNADFDGDTMSVHVPLSKKAQKEAVNLVLSTKNIMSSANGRPIATPEKDMILGIHYMTKVRCNVKGEGIVFASIDEVIMAFQCGEVLIHAQIKVYFEDVKKLVSTTPGRILLFNILPKGSKIEWVNKVLKKSDVGGLVENVYHQFGIDATVTFLDNIKHYGFYYATMGGISISMNDLVVPDAKESILRKADKEVARIEKLYMNGVITNGERYSKVIGVWGHATADVAKEMVKGFEEYDQQAYLNKDKVNIPFNALFMMLQSRARGSNDNVKQLVGMRGPMAKPTGEIMETPVKSNFRDGLSVFEYFVSTHGARKGQADTALKTANSGYLTRRLVDVAQDVIVVSSDCKTVGYIEVTDLKEAGDIICSVAHRVYGRVLAADVKDPVTGTLLLKQGEVIMRKGVDILEDSSVSKILVRSVLTCQAKRGVCVECFGLDLARGAMIDIGATVGIVAAQSIGEPGTQLTLRTFHIGGTATGVTGQSTFVSRYSGTVSLSHVRLVQNRDGHDVVMSHRTKLTVMSPDGRELQQNDIEYGTVLFVRDGQEIDKNVKMAEWDNYNKLILTEKAGKVRFVDLVDNVTCQERVEASTKQSSILVIEHREDKLQPAIIIEDKDGKEIANYFLPVGAYLNVREGQEISPGDVLVKIPREISRTKDITGGLPRIAELFEARMPKDAAIISDIDGEVVFGGSHRGLRKVSVVSGDQSCEYFIPRDKQLNVLNGDSVKAGDLLTEGSPVLYDMLRILGPDYVQTYLVDHIQKIYRLQGIDINDKHKELIVRQMMRKVRVVEPGDTEFLIGDRIDRIHFKMVNSALKAEGKKTATAIPILMGITQASLSTESFIAAASFQETPRILCEAAISGQVDYLYGPKENVIVGKLIPAGTGVASFRKKYIGEAMSDLEEKAREEEGQTV
ncbi:MAG: DNA-directed RNA polymerase subunit beta' [Candidatus Babeliales bacterium]